jgi:hypothetical protein
MLSLIPMPDTPQSAPEGSNSPEVWLSVAMVSGRLGISARAVQKRCAGGTLPARRVVVPGGIRWEVDGRAIGHELDANPANFGREPANQNGSRVRSFDAQEGANPRTDGRELDANQGRELRELLAREREFSGFLKLQLEEANRNAGELRAALREALKMAPKQLPAPSPTHTDETARSAPERAKKSEAGNHTQGALNGSQASGNHGETPVSYGSVADELERMLNQ